MKKSLFFLLIAGILSCNKEGDVAPAEEKTFLRYFGNKQNHVAVLALEDNNGFSLLSTEQIETGVAGQIKSKIHFTRINQFGNLEWEFSYPPVELDVLGITDVSENRTAASFIPLTNSGYLIIGNRINDDNTTDLHLLQIDPQGAMQQEEYISLKTTQKPLLSLEGRAIIEDGTDYLILGAIKGNGAQDMFVAQIVGDDLDSCRWKREYGDTQTALINRLYLVNGQNVWGGTVLFNNTYDARIVRVDPNTQPTQIGGNIGTQEFNENALDFAKAINGWVITGYTNEGDPNDPDNNPQLTEDIFVMKVNDGSTQIFNTQIFGESGKNERGVSITATSDQNYVVLGTAGTSANSDDIFLQKINDSGIQVWKKKDGKPDPRYFGGADKQEAASVRETSDGSLLIFGTTYFGNETKLMLLKVDKNGRL